jgi:hypothetical protein
VQPVIVDEDAVEVAAVGESGLAGEVFGGEGGGEQPVGDDAKPEAEAEPGEAESHGLVEDQGELRAAEVAGIGRLCERGAVVGAGAEDGEGGHQAAEVAGADAVVATKCGAEGPVAAEQQEESGEEEADGIHPCGGSL